MEFRVLGPLEVVADGRQLPLGGVKQRAVLAMLVLRANQVVGVPRLIDELWGDNPPKSAVSTLQSYVSHLRDALDPARAGGAQPQVLVTRAPGYVLRASPEEVDALRFERLVGEGQSALQSGDPRDAAEKLREGLKLWRGAALGDLVEQMLTGERTRLEELRLVAVENRIEAELQLGQHARLVGELERLVAEHPLRERLRAQLMLALYRTDRQAEALAAYQNARSHLGEELGLDPGERLRQLEQAIFARDPSLEWPGQARIAAPVAAPRQAPSITAAADVFVGREAELTELRAALADARAGRTRLMLVGGDPGIGKSRVADKLAEEASDVGVQVLLGRAWEEDGAPTYWPWVKVFKAWMEGRAPEHLLEILSADGAAALALIVPDLHERLHPLPELPPLEPAEARFRLFGAVRRWLERAAEERPLLIVLDDLHRVDQPSLLLLRHLARELTRAQLLVIATFRHKGAAPTTSYVKILADLTRERTTDRVELGGLTEKEIAQFVELAAGSPASAAHVQWIHQQTSGNPLLMWLLRTRQPQDRTRTEADGAVDIPQSVLDIVRAWVEDLSEPGQQVLATASVLGREFDVDVLSGVIGTTSDTLLEQLEEPVTAGIVNEMPDRPGGYRFAHMLVRDAVYSQVSAARRARLHRQTAETLEGIHAQDLGPHLAELAHHFHQGARGLRDDRALGYTVQAGERAVALLAYEEGARLFDVALRQPIDPPYRCDLLLMLADAQMKAGAVTRARETLIQAAEIAKTIGAPEALARAALGFGAAFDFTLGQADVTEQITELLEAAHRMLPPEDSLLRAQVLGRLAMALYWAPLDEQPAARVRRDALSAEAVRIARGQNDQGVLARVLYARCFATWEPDTLMERIALSAEIIGLGGALDAQELVLDGRRWQIVNYAEAGNTAAMERALQAYVKGAEQLRQPLYLYWSAILRSSQALLHGQFEEAQRLSFEALEIGKRLRDEAITEAQNGVMAQFHAIRREQGRMAELEPAAAAFVENLPDVLGWRMGLAMIYASTGQLDKARPHFDYLAQDAFTRIPRDAVWMAAMAGCAEICAALGDADRAAELYDLLLPYQERCVVISFGFAIVGSVAHFLGQLAIVLHRWDDAMRHLEAATELHVRIDAKPALSRTWYEHGRALLARSQAVDRPQAQQLLVQAHKTATELGMERLQAQASAATEVITDEQ